MTAPVTAIFATLSSRGDRHQFGDALDNAQHGDFRIAERDKPLISLKRW